MNEVCGRRLDTGLKAAPDGSVTITMAKKQPNRTPKANWLPVPNDPFNVILRAYGPEGDVASGSSAFGSLVETAAQIAPRSAILPAANRMRESATGNW